MKGPISPVARQCVPPQSSAVKSPPRTTLTFSPYFSPNSAVTPFDMASSRDVSVTSTGRFSIIFSFTISSTSLTSCSSIAKKWLKSKRSLSEATREPACLIWSPRTAFNAVCRRWVAVWFLIMDRLLSSCTDAWTDIPFFIVPLFTVPEWTRISLIFFV